MKIDLQFKQKFYGIVYAQLDRNSACKVAGNGENTTTIQIPLKGCGTQQVENVNYIVKYNLNVKCVIFADQHPCVHQ